MNYKTVSALFIIFVLLNLGIFTFYKFNKENSVKQQKLVSAQSPNIPVQDSKIINLPVGKTHKAVNSINLTYGFEGKITKIDPAAGNEIYITLNTSDSQTPLFVTNPNTFINSQASPGKALLTTDLKTGQNILLTEVFDTTTNKWSLIGVLIENK